MIKTRFAPSPTGPMHLGNVRTAPFNHCLAGREKGVFGSLDHLGRSPARFGASKLDHWQREPHRPQHPRRSVGVDEPFGRRGGAGKDTARLRRGDPRQRPAARGRTPLGRDRVRR
jgi:tRNA synthetases class I (E and Q), catalytic domain